MTRLAVTFEYVLDCGSIDVAGGVLLPSTWGVHDVCNSGFWVVPADIGVWDIAFWKDARHDPGARWIPPGRVLHVRAVPDPVATQVVFSKDCNYASPLRHRKCVLSAGHPGPHLFNEAGELPGRDDELPYGVSW